VAALLFATPALATLTKAQTATLSVIKFELAQDASHHAVEANDYTRAGKLLKGEAVPSEAGLDELWPYWLHHPMPDGSRLALPPPYAGVMFPARIPYRDLEKLKGLKFLKQFQRTLSPLVGKGGFPSYLEAVALTDEDCHDVAEALTETYHGSLPNWELVVPLARKGIALQVAIADLAMEMQLTHFMSKLSTPSPESSPMDIQIEEAWHSLAQQLETTKDPGERVLMIHGFLEKLLHELPSPGRAPGAQTPSSRSPRPPLTPRPPAEPPPPLPVKSAGSS
jgi:hypothetical protein